ncbi:MAG TPA: ABC transporter permease [Vicinamibacterales bacterium]|nr:ABC transporter permease [Vicinamibacterales bacterium]
MALVPIVAMVRKDLQLFFSDRRAVIMSFLVPIAIASFFGSIFSGPSRNVEPARIAVSIVDQDDSPISRRIVASAQADRNLKVTRRDEADARDAVRRGAIVVAVVVPKGFGEAAGNAFFSNGEKPPLGLFYDPSRAMELAMVRGVMTEHIMQAVSQEMFGGEQGRAQIEKALPEVQRSTMPDDQKRLLLEMLASVQKFYNRAPAPGDATPARGITMPYTVREEAVTAGSNVAYNGYAHSFAGMGIQFLLFAMANLGIEMLLERQKGLWKRLRSAPLSRVTVLTAKALSGTIISLMTLWVSFAFAMIVFRVRIEGSVPGFVGISLGVALMAASFGLLVAALGNTPASARGITTFAILIMVMLGGAWVPAFVFPAWLQQFTLIVPVRWAVDGFDAMTWRGIGISGAAMPAAVLVGFAGAFMLIAAMRFKWEEA